MANLPLAFAELLGGGILLTAGISGSSISQVFAGQASLKSLDAGGAASGGAPGGGAPAAPAKVRAWVAKGLTLAGVPATPANIDTVVGRVMQESGGNPQAINLTDSNAQAGHPSKGFLQTIDSTFHTYMVPGHGNIWNPVDNTAAAVRYMLARYGHLVGAGPGGY